MPYTYIFFGIYSLVILGIFAFYVVFFLHVKKFQGYSHYLSVVFRIVIILTIIIALFGGYMLLTESPQGQDNSFNFNTNTRIDY